MNEFILPDIGEGIVECELLEWLVKEGDVIVEDQPVAEVMTDKATVQIPSMHNGTVTKLHYKQGDIAKVHAPLFAMSIADHKTENLTSGDNSKSVAVAPTAASENSVVSSKIESFILPDIGEGIVECEIVKWCINEGDVIVEDQVVVEVMTDKAVVEIPAKFNGKVTQIHYKEGEIAKVHTALFEQEIDGHSSVIEPSDAMDGASDVATDGIDKQQAEIAPDPSNQVLDDKQGGKYEAPVLIDGKVLASPAVRRIARELNVDLSSIAGSGKKGRVLKQDLITASSKEQRSNVAAEHSKDTNNAQNMPAHSLPNQNANPSVTPVSMQQNSVEVIPIRGMKAAMARQMVASVSTIPHFSVADELCMDKLITLRSNLKAEFERHELKLSFMPFFIKSLSLALSAFPELNSHVNDKGDELHVFSSHNIGMAVDSKVGLLVPNIKNVQALSLLEVTKEVNRIIDAAREGKLSNTDLNEGTISISNIGVLGGITATPVINKPEVAIVALGKTQKLPRFDENGDVSATNIMMLNWSGDHRVIDGATMVKFNNLWMSYLQNPEKMLVHLK